MNQAIQNHQNYPPIIPYWLVITQSACFAILYAVWMLPKTIFLRNSCLGIGATLSIFVICRYRKSFLSKAAMPAFLLLALYGWLLFHLLFLSNDYQSQYLELTSVWKNSFIGVIFGLGFGIALSSSAQDSGVNKKSSNKFSVVIWFLIWLGLAMPELIYIVKWTLMRYAVQWNLNIPEHLKLFSASASYYISKNTYVCFCLPALVIALGQIKYQLDQNRLLCLANIFYLCIIAGTLFVFWGERIFNGFIYAFLCTTILGCMLLWGHIRRLAVDKWLISLFLVIGMASGLIYQINRDHHFQSFIVDAKIAVQLDKFPQWKFNGEQGYPQNELGSQVNSSNYERISWFMYGMELIPRHPLGYGLLQSSFGRLVKLDYPDSKMHQSHSGWVDLTLGLGLSGVGLILGALLFTLRKCSLLRQIPCGTSIPSKSLKTQAYLSLGWWVLLGLGLAWCTTELSQRLYIDNLLFWIALATGLNIGSRSYEK